MFSQGLSVLRRERTGNEEHTTCQKEKTHSSCRFAFICWLCRLWSERETAAAAVRPSAPDGTLQIFHLYLCFRNESAKSNKKHVASHRRSQFFSQRDGRASSVFVLGSQVPISVAVSSFTENTWARRSQWHHPGAPHHCPAFFFFFLEFCSPPTLLFHSCTHTCEYYFQIYRWVWIARVNIDWGLAEVAQVYRFFTHIYDRYCKKVKTKVLIQLLHLSENVRTLKCTWSSRVKKISRHFQSSSSVCFCYIFYVVFGLITSTVLGCCDVWKAVCNQKIINIS